MIWNDVGGFNYQVNELGHIRNTTTKKVLTPVTKNGYLSIRLNKAGHQVSKNLHRLVYTAFGGEIPLGYQIDHKNGIKNDNRIENLEAVTPEENQSRRLNLRRGSAVNTSKLSSQQVLEIRGAKSRGLNSRELASQYGVTKSAINRVARGFTWKHLPSLPVDNSIWGDPKLTGAISGRALSKKYGKDYFSRIATGQKIKQQCSHCGGTGLV